MLVHMNNSIVSTFYQLLSECVGSHSDIGDGTYSRDNASKKPLRPHDRES